MTKSKSPQLQEEIVEIPEADPSSFGNDTSAILEHAAEEVYGALVEDTDDEDLDEDALWLREQRESNKSLHWLLRPTVLTMCFVALSYFTGMAIAEPGKSLAIYQLACNTVETDGVCDPVSTQILVSTLAQYQLVVGTSFALLASTKVGVLSDIYGRKPLIAGYIVANTLQRYFQYFLFAHYKELPFVMLVVGEGLVNFCGGLSSFGALMQAYISDVVEPHQRIYSIGLAMAAMQVGAAIGPIICNLIVSQIKDEVVAPIKGPQFHVMSISARADLRKKDIVPLQVELFVFTLLAIYLVFFFPESRSEKAKTKSRSNSVASGNSSGSGRLDAVAQLQTLEQPTLLNRVGHMLNLFRPLILLTYPASVVSSNNKSRHIRYRIAIISIVLVGSIVNAIVTGIGTILIQYGILKFNWDTQDLGYMLSLFSGSMTFMYIVGSPILIHTVLRKWCGLKVMKRQLDMVDFSVILFARVADIFAFVFMAMAKNTGQMLASLSLIALGAPAGPTISSALLKFYPASKAGEFFATMSLLQNIFTLVFPLATLSLFKYGLKNGVPQLGFYLVAVACLVNSIVIIFVKKVLRLNRHSTDDQLVRSSSMISLPSSHLST
ncbi:hypothetical protein G9P44_005363 [Scheffersomyces stipitis]|nr:hypothetical protein G9P44_005363 [Scheffersomyces stipitis]